MQSGIWTNTEALIVKRYARPPCHLLQITGIVEASTSRKRNRHHLRFELNKLAQDRNDIRSLRLQPNIAELHASDKLHKYILRLRSVVRRRRVIVNLRNRQSRSTEEMHRGHFTGYSVELGDCGGIRDTGYHLEAVMHGDKKNPVKATFGELYKCVDVLRSSTDRLRRESTKFVNVELASALCEAKIVVDAEYAKLWIRHIRQKITCYKTYSQRPDE